MEDEEKQTSEIYQFCCYVNILWTTTYRTLSKLTFNNLSVSLKNY